MKKHLALKMFLLLFCFCGTAAEAKAGFGTGLVVGYLFGSSSSSNNKKIIEKYGNEPTYDERLYDEYKRNEILINKGVASSRDLVVRNNQIAKEFADAARKKYINAFDLELIPVSKKVIENLVIYNDEIRTRLLNFSLEITGNDKSPAQFSNHRDEVKYEIRFKSYSPQQISDFNIIEVNGQPAEHIDGKWFYTHHEAWGINKIMVKVQDLHRSSLNFSISYSYEVENPNLTKKFAEVISSDHVSDGFFILVFKIAAVLMALMLGAFILRDLGKSNPHPR